MARDNNLDDHLHLDKLRSINYYTREAVEEHVVDINNKLVDICNLLDLDLKEIKPIHPNKELRKSGDTLKEEEKRAIIAAIELGEKKESIKKKAMRAAGITDSEYNRISKEDLINKMKQEKSSPKPPPKTEWEKITIDSDERNKIIQSIKANKQSKNIFSKDFKWEPKNFLSAFSFLEEAKGYTGPFLTSVIDNKSHLERLSKYPDFQEKIHQVYFGKYVVLSMYDIASDESWAKQMYVGLSYKPMTGRLWFNKLLTNSRISQSQKIRIREFFDKMDIIYDNQHKDLQWSSI